MASMVDLKSVNYAQVRKIYVPKHKGNLVLARRNQMLRGKSLLEKQEKVEEKGEFIKSVCEIQKIMKHFDAKFSGQRVGKKRRNKTLPRKVVSISQHDPDSLKIQKKISHLINLPALKSIKTQAQRHRSESTKQWQSERQHHKSIILTDFSTYLNTQLRISPSRFPTIT